MSALVIANSQPKLKCVVFSPSGIPRAVSKVNKDGGTEQCLVDGDIIFYKNRNESEFRISFHSTSAVQPVDVAATDALVKKCADNVVQAFLGDDNVKLPAELGWDGETTINDLVFQYGLDRFLTGFADFAILGGLMGLTNDFNTPSVGTFDVDVLFANCNVSINDRGNKRKLDTLFETVDPDYYADLQEGGISLPADSLNWRAAKKLPEVMSVSCILKDGVPIRYNDLLVWREGYGEPELVSVVDLVKSFKMKDTNFLSLPYVIDKYVTRVMFILHQADITPECDTVVWLYRAR